MKAMILFDIAIIITISLFPYHMDRDIKIFNRPIMQKIQKKNYELHLRRLKNIKSGNSNRTCLNNTQHRHLNSNKTILLEQQKRTQIEKQNMILFNKMSKIMHRADQHRNPNLSYSCNSNKIIEQHNRIRQQNKNLYHRLQSQRPTISNKKLYEERSKKQTLLRFMGRYPNRSANRFKISTESNSYSQPRYSEIKRNSYSTHYKIPEAGQFQMNQNKQYCEQVAKIQNQGLRKHVSESVTNKIVDAKVIQRTTNNQLNKLQDVHVETKISAKRRRKGSIVLFQARGKVANKHAIVYFKRTYDSYQIRTKFDTPIYGEIYHEIKMSEQEGNKFFSQNNYDYSAIVNMLYFKNRQLAINQGFQEDNQSNLSSQKLSIHDIENL